MGDPTMTPLRPTVDTGWSTYLRRFHEDRPGITEHILTRCRAEGMDPYRWCAQALPDQDGPVLDVACGSGPMADHLDGWIGADDSAAELAIAQEQRRHPAVRGSATQLPLRAGTLDAVVCSMAMQIIDPLTRALAELARVLRAGGRAVLLLPAPGPLPWRDLVVYGHLQLALRQRIGYPNDHALRPGRLRRASESVGLRVTRDERLPFTLPLGTASDVDDLLASLYLPGVGPGRVDAGRRVLGGRAGGSVTVPLRRIVLERAGAAP
jgi:SAM-dependent methyltransferase